MKKKAPAFTTATCIGLALAVLGSSCSDETPSNQSASETTDAGNTDATQTDDCLNKPDAPECLDEKTAFFVAAAGNDASGDGTRAKPFKSVTTVLAKITDARKRIYVCGSETFDEDVVIEAKHAGVSLFGGFTCAWQASDAKPTFGKSTTALKITGATGVAISNVAFVAKDAKTPSGSSIAAFVANAEVTFKGVALTAGKGFKGDNGDLSEFNYPDPSELKGNNGDAPANGAEKAFTCPDGAVTKGGRGGPVGGFDGESGTPGPENKGIMGICAGPGTGKDGALGASPVAAPTMTTLGELSTEAWRPKDGLKGAKGGPGQGGGGGYSSGGGVGGSGGAGGCGGAGGGGGASAGLVSHEAVVRLTTTSVALGLAGSGGDGAAGQIGQPQTGTRGTGSGTSCNGGNGGPGGNGAPGGGGAGGVAVGVLYKGTKPELDDATRNAFTPGTKGAAGAGPGNPGIDGFAGLELKVD